MPRKKTVKRKKAGKRKTKQKALPFGRGWGSLWPVLVGAVIVVATCWLLFSRLFSSPVKSDSSVPKGYTVRGIDVSHHQGNINWELLSNQATIDGLPVSFAFIKATEGSDMVDARFAYNFAEARRYGIPRGAYHFYSTASPARQQAEHFMRHVKLQPGDLPPVLDVEVHPQGITAEDFRQGILEWLARIEQHYGVKPILYTYYAFRQQFMNDPVFDLYPFWIAHYHVDSVRYRGRWDFWQHSDKGELSGIKGKVDLNIFNGSDKEFEQLLLK